MTAGLESRYRFGGLLLLFVIYFCLGRLGIAFASLPPGNLTLIWLPSGVALVALLIMGWRAVPVIFLASLAINAPFLIDNIHYTRVVDALFFGGAIALVDTVQTVAAYIIFRILRLDNPFERGRTVLQFFGMVAFVPCALTGWIVIGSLQVGNYSGAFALNPFLLRCVALTLADTLGICLVTTLYFGLRHFKLSWLSLPQAKHTAISLVLIAGVCLVTFHVTGLARYLVMPLMLYAVIYARLWGASLGLLVISGYFIAATAQGFGPYARPNSVMAYTGLISFLLCFILPLLYLHGVLQEQRRSRDELDYMVKIRTAQLQGSMEELARTLAEVKEIQGILPICAHCKKIRDDDGYWRQVEAYVQDHSKAHFSHGICPECAKKYYPELATDK